MSQGNTRTSAYSWHEAMRRARNQKYNTKIDVPKAAVGGIPPEFDRSPPPYSIKKNAIAVYRDQQPTDSFQIREYETKYTIEMDQHNPETGNPVAHAVHDATAYTAVAAVALGATLFS